MSVRDKFCLSANVCKADSFLCLSCLARVLYFFAILDADTYGVIVGWQRLARMVAPETTTTGEAARALDELLASGHILQVDGETLVIRDWWLHNTWSKISGRTKCALVAAGVLMWDGEPWKSAYKLNEKRGDDGEE